MTQYQQPTEIGFSIKDKTGTDYRLALFNHLENEVGLRLTLTCRLATTVALTATYNNGTSGVGATLTNSGTQGVLTLDTIPAVVGDQVIVKDQATAFQNGIYAVTNIGSASTNWVLTRVTNADLPEDFQKGKVIGVIAGATNAGQLYIITSDVTAIGTSAITFLQVNPAQIKTITGTTNQIIANTVNGVTTLSFANNAYATGEAFGIPVTATIVTPPVAGKAWLFWNSNTLA